MNIIYTWAISSMKMAPALDGLSDVITNVKFKYTGTDSDSGFSAEFMGAIPIGQPESGSFIPLADLTENEVIEWVKSIYNLDHPNSVILKQINEKIQPTNQEVHLPWEPPLPDPPVTPTP